MNQEEEDESDNESEMMIMQPSDSMSSMGSQMIRVDSTQALSKTSSFSDIHAHKTNYNKA